MAEVVYGKILGMFMKNIHRIFRHWGVTISAETTEANKFESTDTKEISNVKIAEASKQEINIGIVVQ